MRPRQTLFRAVAAFAYAALTAFVIGVGYLGFHQSELWYKIANVGFLALVLWLFYLAELFPHSAKDQPGERAKPSALALAAVAILAATSFF
jgi:hypothetical protein